MGPSYGPLTSDSNGEEELRFVCALARKRKLIK